MSSLTAFVIGAGTNVGMHVAAAFKAKGYRVALASRNPDVDALKKEGYFPVALDVQNIGSVQGAFAAVNKELGPPSVVVFNVASVEPPPASDDPLSLGVKGLAKHVDMSLAMFAAAQEAVTGFRAAANKGAKCTFIATGNPLPWAVPPLPLMVATVGLNIQKTIEWRILDICTAAYAKEKFRFYFATLVAEDGGILDPLSDFFTSGPQHAQVYLDLITREEQADWDYRFTLDAKQVKK
ncbi:hypothetical protein B0H15DRAFT_944788 [Mycena belliarum]|uniref:NAD(P)-binding protein n=1 Tax=Mycena belliarum TaxID=1033014 RepID=A0AAD6UCU5_9AGAR|nr:hypothetical protein B0H15DRAFT_944788 [Mycena belliae]